MLDPYRQGESTPPPPERRERKGAPPRVYPPSIVDPGAQVGLDVVIGAFCYVAAGAVIGAGTRIQSHTSVWDGVLLGEDVFVGPAAVFTNIKHPRAAYARAPRWDRTVVEDGASLGAGCVLVAPVHIGKNAMVGAGAIVTRDVAAHAVVVGNPARIVGWSCACGETAQWGGERPDDPWCGCCER
jgi:UDP-2-acetamido-3-amino-2,3-dideoxy-glucuronate N-acetyltransferase